MTNEAVLVQDLEYRHLEVSMADGSAGDLVLKGTILALSDANVGAASSADNDLFLGILLEDNVGADGQTRYAVSRKGVWDIKDSGTGTGVGIAVMIKGANVFAISDATSQEMGQLMGMTLQTAAGSEVVEVLVGAWG